MLTPIQEGLSINYLHVYIALKYNICLITIVVVGDSNSDMWVFYWQVTKFSEVTALAGSAHCIGVHIFGLRLLS